jgi:hypothetical protein|tara:strand:- start:376 stop:867 length:492 start_codon:yes stop_codon:yes gene_type:complete
MKTKSSFVIIFIVSFLFGQEKEITHINKTHSDGTPKEVIVYKRVNDDLQSNNPFEIVKKVSYDSKGNWLRPKLQGAAKKAELMIIGNWKEGKDAEEDYISFKRDGTYKVYEKGEENDSGAWFLTQEGDDIFITNKKNYEKNKIVFLNNNQFRIGNRWVFNRKK